MNIDSKQFQLSARLWREVVLRNRFAGLAHLHLAIMSVYFTWDMYSNYHKAFTCIGFIFVGCIFRHMTLRQIGKVKVPSLSLEILHHASLVSLGTGWALNWYDVQSYFGILSLQGIMSFIILCGLISTAVHANAGRPAAYFALTAPVIAIPVFTFFTLHSFGYGFLIYSILFYFAFNIYQLKMSYHFLKGFIEKDLDITFERDRLQTLINAVPGYVSFIDSNLNYLAVNEFGKAIFNLRDYHFKFIGQGFENTDFTNFVLEFMQSKKKTSISEICFKLTPVDSTFIVSIQKIDNGGAVIVAIPMDELMETREKIKAQEAKSFYTSKLISLGEMAAGIAHEINNPLAIILASSDQIQREMKKPNINHERIGMLTDKIHKTVERISLIIKSLRALARNGEKDPFVPFKLDSIIEPSIEISRQRFLEENVNIEIVTQEESLLCLGQEIQLAQVMMNLLSNAFDAALEGPEPKWVRLKVIPSEEHVDVCIQDSGHGIPLEIRHKIMDPFFTTKAINKGTGLGLSISKSIMEQHGGSLTLDESSTNTTFVMRMRRVLG